MKPAAAESAASATAETRTRCAFDAVLQAMSMPGTVHLLPQGAGTASESPESFAMLAEVFLDLETSFWTPNEGLEQAPLQAGARRLDPEQANYHFYSVLDDAALDGIARASVGTLLEPDASATLFIGCRLGQGETSVWRGPGIPGERAVRAEGLPPRFWELRDAAMEFPLGWDCLLVDGAEVVGLPRTARVER
jgi:alpha-D-ribose 1-methylphosphonate 5-triphosphate synthase subunit PhnH